MMNLYSLALSAIKIDERGTITHSMVSTHALTINHTEAIIKGIELCNKTFSSDQGYISHKVFASEIPQSIVERAGVDLTSMIRRIETLERRSDRIVHQPAVMWMRADGGGEE